MKSILETMKKGTGQIDYSTLNKKNPLEDPPKWGYTGNLEQYMMGYYAHIAHDYEAETKGQLSGKFGSAGSVLYKNVAGHMLDLWANGKWTSKTNPAMREPKDDNNWDGGNPVSIANGAACWCLAAMLAFMHLKPVNTYDT